MFSWIKLSIVRVAEIVRKVGRIVKDGCRILGQVDGGTGRVSKIGDLAVSVRAITWLPVVTEKPTRYCQSNAHQKVGRMRLTLSSKVDRICSSQNHRGVLVLCRPSVQGR
jgi:hypothetical protein